MYVDSPIFEFTPEGKKCHLVMSTKVASKVIFGTMAKLAECLGSTACRSDKFANWYRNIPFGKSNIAMEFTPFSIGNTIFKGFMLVLLMLVYWSCSANNNNTETDMDKWNLPHFTSKLKLICTESPRAGVFVYLGVVAALSPGPCQSYGQILSDTKTWMIVALLTKSLVTNGYYRGKKTGT